MIPFYHSFFTVCRREAPCFSNGEKSLQPSPLYIISLFQTNFNLNIFLFPLLKDKFLFDGLWQSHKNIMMAFGCHVVGHDHRACRRKTPLLWKRGCFMEANDIFDFFTKKVLYFSI